MAIDPAQALPRRFGRYLLLERLGAGGMAEVFIARRLARFDELCALKKMRPEISRDDEFVKRFADEARLVVAMNHPNLVKVHEVGWVRGEPFVAMELVQGHDLGKLLARAARCRRALPIPGAVFIACEVLRGLEYCHHRTDAAGVPLGVVHRDIAPGNVLVAVSGDVKIADFGLAVSALRTAHTRPHMLLGKPGYVAPERLVGGPVDHRADIFNVGILLFELLTGERFAMSREPARLVAEMRSRAGAGIRRVRSAISQDLEEVVARALALDSGGRFRSAIEFRRALEQGRIDAGPPFGRPELARLLGAVFDVPAIRARFAALLQESLPGRRAGPPAPRPWIDSTTLVDTAPTGPVEADPPSAATGPWIASGSGS